jgi:cyclopropane-fatty-acyl-phospholipid synthase
VERDWQDSPSQPEVTVIHDGSAAATGRFLETLFPSPRNFDIDVGGSKVVAADTNPEFSLKLRAGESVRALFRPPVEVSLGNGFISGEIEVTGDVCRVFPVVDACRQAARSPRRLAELARLWRALPPPAPVRNVSREAPSLHGRKHSETRDREAVVYHYDLGNEFFELFLDPRMIYSCAYFRSEHDDLAVAQEYKLDQVCRKLRLNPGDRMLDVGCGWGGLLMHAASNYGITGTGITLSANQFELARKRVAAAGLTGRIDIRRLDYRELGNETFDRISSIGMFEHVGKARMPEYFATLARALRPGGLLLNHGISRRATNPRRTLTSVLADPLNHIFVGTSPMTKYVFPDTELIELSEINIEGERAGLEIRDVENLREHYALTLRRWITNLEAREDEAVKLAGRATYRLWRLYFAASAFRFETGRINVNQTLFAKPDEGRVEVPLSRADLYS